jgi:hypothetical protein
LNNKKFSTKGIEAMTNRIIVMMVVIVVVVAAAAAAAQWST